MFQALPLTRRATLTGISAQRVSRRFARHTQRMLAVLEELIDAGVHSGTSVQLPCVLALERRIEQARM